MRLRSFRSCPRRIDETNRFEYLTEFRRILSAFYYYDSEIFKI